MKFMKGLKEINTYNNFYFAWFFLICNQKL